MKRENAENTALVMAVMLTGQRLTELYSQKLSQLSHEMGARFDWDTLAMAELMLSASMATENLSQNMYHLQKILQLISKE